MENVETDLIKLPEFMKLWNIKKDVAYQLVRDKSFPSIKLGGEYRIRKSKLNSWLDKQEKNM